MVAQQTDDVVQACGANPSTMCKWVYDATGNEFVADLSDLVFGSIGRIVVILVVAFLVSRFVRRAIAKFARRIELPGSTRGTARTRTLSNILQSVSTAIIWSITFVTILGELDINLGPLVASAGIAGVALGFGAQSLVKDCLSGFFILVEDQYGIGDIVDLGEASGTVEEVRLRTTRLRDVQGTVWHVPNGTIQRVANKSQQWARALLDVSVAYGTDVDRATEVIKSTAEELCEDPEFSDSILEAPEVWGIEQMTTDAIQIRLVVKTRPAEQFKVTRELRRRLLQAFDVDGIQVPNGQRTVWLKDETPPS
jgi:moderate conductance mechanosensitive channel